MNTIALEGLIDNCCSKSFIMPGSSNANRQGWPQDVGIIALELYFPSQYVEQTQLEAFDGVSPGKYTLGLGQSRMGFCSDREDINSLCLTVTERLMERNKIAYNEIGRLEVGTETLIDKSKSTKTVLMQLFEDSGNTDLEGVDNTNACYGGTAALFNSVNWVESSAWDGRYALVVAGDIAIYASGNARCTGGAGAVAMLIGPHAPLILDRGVRSSHMEHAYDFYKPDMSSEYPVVDGKLSIQCYLNALDKCYERYTTKAMAAGLRTNNSTLDIADAFVFHAPYGKLVQKSFARLLLNDFLRDGKPDYKGRYSGLEAFKDIKLEDTYFDKSVETAIVQASKSLYEEKTKPSLLVSNQVGNMYTPSVYSGLASYISCNTVESVADRRIVLFSYGSGLAASMFSMRFSDQRSSGGALDSLVKSLADLKARLDARQCVPPMEFDSNLKLREQTHHLAPYTPVGSVQALAPGTWYVTDIDNMHRRKYERRSSSPSAEGHSHQTGVKQTSGAVTAPRSVNAATQS